MAGSAHTTRRATSADAHGIAAVHVHAWQAVYDGLAPAEYLDSLCVEDRAMYWERWLAAGAQIVVAESHDEIVGFCGVGKARDQGSARTVGEIYAMYIDPHCRRHAIGTDLCRAGLELLRNDGFGKVVLWVLEGYSVGRSFYEALGFLPDGNEATVNIGGKDLPEIRYSITP